MGVIFYTKLLFVYLLIVFTLTDNLEQFRTVSPWSCLWNRNFFLKFCYQLKLTIISFSGVRAKNIHSSVNGKLILT